MNQVPQDRKVGSQRGRGARSVREKWGLQECMIEGFFLIQVDWGVPAVQEIAFYIHFLSIFNKGNINRRTTRGGFYQDTIRSMGSQMHSDLLSYLIFL